MPAGVALGRLAKGPAARAETVCQRNWPPDHQRGKGQVQKPVPWSPESDAFDHFDAPILRLGAADAPVPYNPDLERPSVPQTGTIEAAARRLVRRKV